MSKLTINQPKTALNLGKPMPAAAKVEQKILGGILQFGLDAYILLQSTNFALNEADFHSEKHAKIWNCIELLGAALNPIDMVSVFAAAAQIGADSVSIDPYYLTQMVDTFSYGDTTANLEFYAQVLKSYAIRRRLIEISAAANDAAYDSTIDALELLSGVQEDLGAVLQGLGKTATNITGLLGEIVNEATNPAALKLPSKTGLRAIDLQLSGGIFDDDFLFLLGGYSGSGKTALMLNVVIQKILDGIPVAVFSYEMTVKTLTIRIISAMSGIEATLIKTQEIPEHLMPVFNQTVEWLAQNEHLLNLIDCTGMPIAMLCAKIAGFQRGGVKYIYIDHFDEIPAIERVDENTSNKVKITMLRDTAKALGSYIFLLVQLRKPNNIGGLIAPPTMSDVKGTSAIYQCASIIALIHSLPESIEQKELHFVKVRNGSTGVVEMIYNGACFHWIGGDKELGSQASEQEMPLDNLENHFEFF